VSREALATPHVAVVSQNADLELDIRPRAEAEALARAGYRVTLVGGTRNPERVREITDPAVDLALYSLPSEAAGALGQVSELTKSFSLVARTVFQLARHSPIDVIHAANPPDNLWLLGPVVRMAQRSQPRFVFDQHDVAPVLLAEKYGSGPVMRSLGWLAQVLERASFSRASLAVFANSEYERRALANKLLAGQAAVVPNGWALPEAAPSPRWRGNARRLVAYVGAMGEQEPGGFFMVTRGPQEGGLALFIPQMHVGPFVEQAFHQGGASMTDFLLARRTHIALSLTRLDQRFELFAVKNELHRVLGLAAPAHQGNP